MVDEYTSDFCQRKGKTNTIRLSRTSKIVSLEDLHDMHTDNRDNELFAAKRKRDQQAQRKAEQG